MINYASKDVTYFKEEKPFQNRGKPFQNQQNMFLIIPSRNDQKRIPKSNKMRSRSFHFGTLSIIFGTFSFLKKKSFNFLERVLKRFVFGKFFTGYNIIEQYRHPVIPFHYYRKRRMK